MSKASRKRSHAEIAVPRPAAEAAPLASPVAQELPAANRLVISAILFALVLLVFGRVGSHDFITYDDAVYVTANPSVRAGLTTDSIRWAFTNIHGGPYWQPLTWLSHEADVSLWGIKAGPALVENMLLHAFATVLLFLALARATAAPWRSAIASALWAVHPLRVESVAWIAERKDVLSTFFAMLTLFLFVRYVERKTAGRYTAVLIAFAAGAMAKPMVMSLPLLLLFFDRWPLRRKEPIGRLIAEQVPLAAMAAISLVLTFIGQRTALSPLPVSWRVANGVTNYAAYLGKLAVPVNLSIFYPLSYGIDWRQLAIAAFVLAAISAAVFVLRKTHPELVFGWLWYVVALVPVAGFVQAGAQKMADRFTYLPSVGIVVAVVWFVGSLVPATALRPAFAAATVATLVYASAAFAYVGDWRDAESVFRHALASTDRNALAEIHVANILASSGREQEAEVHYQRALSLSNNGSSELIDYGHALVGQKRYAEAIPILRRAVAGMPNVEVAQESLGMALLQTGQPAEAVEHFQAAQRADNGMRRAALQAEIAAARQLINPAAERNNHGAQLAKDGLDAAAEAEYREALRLDPKLYDAHMNLAALLSRHDRTFEAIAEVQQAATLRPDSVEPKVYLALLYAQANRRRDAAAAADAALRIDAQASNDYFTRALHLQPANDNLSRFIAEMSQ